jgi:hypothetical protein
MVKPLEDDKEKVQSLDCVRYVHTDPAGKECLSCESLITLVRAVNVFKLVEEFFLTVLIR